MEMEYGNFGQRLAVHSAPTLLGIKCASLLSLRCKEFDVDGDSAAFNRRVAAKGLRSRILCRCTERALLLIYHEKLLTARLSDVQVCRMLEECGYPIAEGLDACLGKLSERIAECEDFPHEIGIFLGYPMEDVIGFIENKGENYKFCGFWKVYGCEEAAQRTFSNYKKCRNFLCNKLNEGADIYQALKIS
ncbi:MAG: DUF3793 family protein [Oscillospiraceae bacterium]|nr:DUF3793 family protein [Oscillospiraceae bacterium]